MILMQKHFWRFTNITQITTESKKTFFHDFLVILKWYQNYWTIFNVSLLLILVSGYYISKWTNIWNKIPDYSFILLKPYLFTIYFMRSTVKTYFNTIYSSNNRSYTLTTKKVEIILFSWFWDVWLLGYCPYNQVFLVIIYFQ